MLQELCLQSGLDTVCKWAMLCTKPVHTHSPCTNHVDATTNMGKKFESKYDLIEIYMVKGNMVEGFVAAVMRYCQGNF